jgi:hypothetical protein
MRVNNEMCFEKFMCGIDPTISECGPVAGSCENDNDISSWTKAEQYMAEVTAAITCAQRCKARGLQGGDCEQHSEDNSLQVHNLRATSTRCRWLSESAKFRAIRQPTKQARTQNFSLGGGGGGAECLGLF